MSRDLSQIFTQRTKGRAPTEEPIRPQVNGCRGRHVVLTLAISQDMELVNHWLAQEIVTRSTSVFLINETEQHLTELIHCDDCAIIFDGAHPHLNMEVHCNTLKPFPPEFFHHIPSPFLNPCEQAHIALTLSDLGGADSAPPRCFCLLCLDK